MGAMNDRLTSDLFPEAPLPIQLQGQTDLPGFCHAAQGLLAQHILPGQVSWCCNDDTRPRLPVSGHSAQLSLPPEFLALAEAVIQHRDPDRFKLLYRLLWRLQHEPDLQHQPLDTDWALAQNLAQAVRRDIHELKAFVRFRRVQDEAFTNQPAIGPLHVAWFEPQHHIVETVAPFFARRFRQMRWALLTPECSAEWDGAQLHFGPGAQKADTPALDAGEQLWLRVYRRTFHRRSVRSGGGPCLPADRPEDSDRAEAADLFRLQPA
ncbi:TIGR03915 family putative DNA repair protein [Polaromonas sp. UC242_47]|uniref:TIGR03915 family putative DNA repair protein n=1 Tax=Polaromonas sp. UC242_47 TaxID=3374626 RepID=UPI0037B3BAF3